MNCCRIADCIDECINECIDDCIDDYNKYADEFINEYNKYADECIDNKMNIQMNVLMKIVNRPINVFMNIMIILMCGGSVVLLDSLLYTGSLQTYFKPYCIPVLQYLLLYSLHSCIVSVIISFGSRL